MGVMKNEGSSPEIPLSVEMSQAGEEKRRREETGRRGRQRSRGGRGADTGRSAERLSERFLAGFDSVPLQYQLVFNPMP